METFCSGLILYATLKNHKSTATYGFVGISKVLKSVFKEFFVVLLASMVVGAEKVVFRVDKGVKVIEFLNLLRDVSNDLLGILKASSLKFMGGL